MQTTHDALWIAAVATAWVLGYLGAQFWMIGVGCALLTFSLFLELRGSSDRYSREYPFAARALAKATVQIGLVLLVYVAGLAARQIGD
jgi:hypothetical protein